ncbi:DUF4139 domain-containing protein [Prolixibacter denitrificans]|uniref:Uncharacterized protein (TIGR02231 family) n=1 Tax=Prolixibacter denitrificans TaxID=1541063 RepID=A0A2P8C836_9BACT|nr:DUF4139 domain-containing protein [Prolixibacter denitrificans]PSK81134.1 uncharacterized protein (TIGR02231 family) [Prolixibacter denitrificans]GET22251.1 hypothetical protein JCM18694_24970 [Prolixibacter denitrificans]
MKRLHLILPLLLISSIAFSQEIKEKNIETKVNKVTVFIEGAQITREKTVDIPQGTSLLTFVNLSPFIDAKSVQVKANGEVTVLSVNHQQNYIEKLEKPKEIEAIEAKIESTKNQLELEKAYLSINHEELEFLNKNRAVGGRTTEMSLNNLKEISAFYNIKLTSLKLDEIEKNKKIRELTEQLKNLEDQRNTLTSKKEYPNGEVVVKVEAKTPTKAAFALSYLVGNAGWFPSYDIRAKSIDDPVEITYKANLRQDTKIDWNNVNLTFSSSNPNSSGVAPELKTYYLGYGTRPPVYTKEPNLVSGLVLDDKNQSLPGTTVVVAGTTIGTVTDVNGNYSITLPPGKNQLTYSFVGFETQTLPVSGKIMNVTLQESKMALDEVVVTAYGISKSNNLARAVSGKAAGVQIRGTNLQKQERENIPVPFQKTENQTNVEFEIKTPYTVKSDNKNLIVDMDVYHLPATYQYFCIPKIDKDAFLLANINDWEKYSLLEGEANIFFEDTYIGKTLLDVRYASDTLQVSLGRDKNVTVNRIKIKDHTTRQFIGNKKEETRAYTLTAKNNKSQAINMTVADQVPVSTREEIEVETNDISGGKVNKDSGEVKWNFTLLPSQKKEWQLMYSVKYPKYRQLTIE